MIGCSRRLLALLVACTVGLAAAAAAQGLPDRPAQRSAPEKQGRPETPPDAKPPRSDADRGHNLDFLFSALKQAPDATTAKLVENRIQAVWLQSGSDTADLLMSRAKTAIAGNDHDLAIRLLDAVVEIKPDYAEAWNRRATLFFIKNDYIRAIQDIRQVLAREPRHFGALAGLGMILNEFGDEKRALEIFRKALEVHPHLPRIPDLVKALTEKVEGRDI